MTVPNRTNERWSNGVKPVRSSQIPSNRRPRFLVILTAMPPFWGRPASPRWYVWGVPEPDYRVLTKYLALVGQCLTRPASCSSASRFTSCVCRGGALSVGPLRSQARCGAREVLGGFAARELFERITLSRIPAGPPNRVHSGVIGPAHQLGAALPSYRVALCGDFVSVRPCRSLLEQGSCAELRSERRGQTGALSRACVAGPLLPCPACPQGAHWPDGAVAGSQCTHAGQAR
jgi:hypothetical protein